MNGVHAGRLGSGYDPVRREFERNFSERGEVGAAVAAYVGREKVVDLRGPYPIAALATPRFTSQP